MKKKLSTYTKSRDNNFNLLRFIAASFVLYTHSFVLTTGKIEAEPLKLSLGITWGSIAVDVFFITSGFLIANSFFSRNNILAFTWARLLRIYPALIVATAFCTFVIGLAFTTSTKIDYLSNIETYRFFLKNSSLLLGVEYYLPNVFSSLPYKGAVNGSIWTLPYEIKMYILLAIIGTVLNFSQKKLNRQLLNISFLCIAIIAVIVNIINHFNTLLSINFMQLFSMFFVGAAIYTSQNNIYLSSRVFFFLLILLALSLFHKNVFFVTYCIFIPYLVFYLAYVPAGKIRLFNKVGDYSYGIYIYAFPVQQSIIALIPDISISAMILLSFVVTFILSFMSWHLIEKKALTMKNFYLIFENRMRNTQSK